MTDEAEFEALVAKHRRELYAHCYSLTDTDLTPWTETTTIMRRTDARKVVAELKAQPGKDILVFGSRILWNDLLAAGLVDELYLMVGPARAR